MVWAMMALAWADCAMPQTVFTAGEAAVPEDPTVWLFLPMAGSLEWVAQATDSKGRSLPVVATSFSGGPDVQAVRLQLDTDGPGTVTLAVGPKLEVFEATETVTLTVGAPPPRVSAEPPSVTVEETATSWMCSWQSTRDLGLPASDAVAYRLEVAPTTEALLGGEATVIVVPDHPQRFWGEAPASGHLVSLGHLNCLGHTHEWAGPVSARVVPLYADGSKGVPSAPVRLEPPSNHEDPWGMKASPPASPPPGR